MYICFFDNKESNICLNATKKSLLFLYILKNLHQQIKNKHIINGELFSGNVLCKIRPVTNNLIESINVKKNQVKNDYQ